MSNYRATVLVSFFNSSRFIVHKMQNLELQNNFDEFEIIFIDGGGDREEVKLVRRFLRGKPNCKLVENDQPITLYDAWNRGIGASSAPLICNSNTDDVLAPDALQKLALFLEKNSSVQVVIPNIFTTTTPNVKWGMVTGGYINTSVTKVMGPFVMWRRKLHDEYGLFDARLHVFGDAEWWNRLRAKKVKFDKVKEYLCIYLCGNGLERRRAEDGQFLRVKDAQLLGLPKGSVEGW